MAETLIKGGMVLTMQDGAFAPQRLDIRLIDGVIRDLGPDLTPHGHVVLAEGCLVTPGLVNTHHHLFQTLTRAVPEGQDARLFGWLRALYPIWARFTPDHVFVSAQLGLAELALSGCSTSSDHLYLYPNGVRLEDTIHAAAQLGVRFHPTRGAMSIGESAGGLPPDSLVEVESAILDDTIRVIDRFHDAAPGSMCRVGVAPCSPFSVSPYLMRDAANLAREKGVRLHTHLAENVEDIDYSEETFGCRPGQYAQDLGWTGEDVWHAHCVKLDGAEIDLFARTQTGVAHCPNSNCRLGSGIAPLRQMLDAKVPVGLGVDGSASNDMASLVAEARQAMLLQRVVHGADAMSGFEALRVATRGGAQVLGRDDIGQIAPGFRADVAVWDMRGLDSIGTWDAGALLLAGPRRVRDLFVEGRTVVSNGHVVTVDLPRLIERAERLLADLMA
ncbi:MAG: 8-oxoguanine deaminase [Pseudomonadota bacterium]